MPGRLATGFFLVNSAQRVSEWAMDNCEAAGSILKIDQLRTPLFGPLSLTVEPGECVAIMGPSGAGKSVFLRAIADLDPNEGDVQLGETLRSLVPAPAWRQMVAMVPAESGWWTDRVRDHFPPDAPGADLIESLGLEKTIISWTVDRLSSGERHRAALARALCRHPEALLLDEPTASLDAATTDLVETLLKGQLAAGLPMIIVTHDAEQAARLAGRTMMLVDGRFSEAAS